MPAQLASTIRAVCAKIDKDTTALAESLLVRSHVEFAVLEQEDTLPKETRSAYTLPSNCVGAPIMWRLQLELPW